MAEGSSLKLNARKLMLKNAPRVFFTGMLYLLFVTILSQLSFRLPGTIDAQNMYERLSAGEMLSINLIYRNFRPIGVFLAVLIYLFMPVFDLGYMSCCLKVKRGQDTEYRDVFYGFSLSFRCLSIFIITTILIFLWSLLLLIPGIVAAYRYRLAYYILLDDPSKGALQCIDESVLMMNGSKMDLFIIDLSFLGWYVLHYTIVLLSPLPYMPPLVQIWLAPYRGIAIAGFYEYRKDSLAV